MTTVAPVDVSGFVVKAGFLEDTAFFACGDGNVLLISGGEVRAQPHKTGLLVAERSFDGKTLLSGGDDGRIVQTAADGTMTELAVKPRKWLDVLAPGPQGAIAYGCGRTAWVRLADGSEKTFDIGQAVGGLAFAPKGLRLAIGHYNGATLKWVNSAGKDAELKWNGAHLSVTFSPDGKYFVTSMQENALHGWRLGDGQDMRMAGYPAKVKSWSWSAKGRYLATSGANAAILWPFFGKSGPMGQTPLQLGARGDALVTAVACHPEEEVVAIGYQDGMVMLCRFEDNAEVMLRRPGAGPISALAWDDRGERLALGSEECEAAIITLPASA